MTFKLLTVALTTAACLTVSTFALAGGASATEPVASAALAAPSSATANLQGLAAASPWIGWGASEVPVWQTLSRERGTDSRTYLPSCPRQYFCVYALFNQNSSFNFWNVWKLYKSTYLGLGQHQPYTLHNFNYNTTGQWIVNNQDGTDWDVQITDQNWVEVGLGCYAAPPYPRPANPNPAEYERRFRSANWWPVWLIFNDADNAC